VQYARSIFRRAAQAFRQPDPGNHHRAGTRHGRNAGIIESEVVLISRKSDEDEVRWVYLDTAKFGGLAETMDRVDPLRYPHPA